MKLIVDTSVVIDKLRGGEFWGEVERAARKEEAEFYVPTVVVFELFSGESTRKKEVVTTIRKWLAQFEMVELNLVIAERAGAIYRDEVKGLQLPDYVIAATALELGGHLVTLNKKHFKRVPGLKIYEV